MATQPSSRLKKFTHEKIREQLQKRGDIPEYEKYLMACKVSEDSVGIVLDTSCPAWKQLQVLVRQKEAMKPNLAINSGQPSSSQQQPPNTPSVAAIAGTPLPISIQQRQQQQQQQQQQQPDTAAAVSSTRLPKLQQVPSTPRLPTTTSQQQQSHHLPPFKPLVLPRCPAENVKALCLELFQLKPGYSGSIFRENFTPEKIAVQVDPISPYQNIPPHLMLSTHISAPAVKRACMHNGMACIPNCLRGIVWAILLDVDLTQIDNNNSGLTTLNQDDHLPPVNGLSVIKVDLHRTYPHVDIFSLPAVQEVMEKLLIKACRTSQLDYKQGMNYLLATLMIVWMPVFSKLTNEDLHNFGSTQQNVTNNGEGNNNNNNNNDSGNNNNSSNGISPAGIPNPLSSPLTLSRSNSNVNGFTAASPNNNNSGNNNTSGNNNNNNNSGNNDTGNSPTNTNTTGTTVHNKHIEYHLQFESEYNSLHKYPQTADILLKNSPIIITTLQNLIAKLLPNTYSDHEFGSLQCLFMFFRLLLQYHDPVLSYHLDYYEMVPEFYSAPFFLTLHVTKTRDISIILLLWDNLLLYLRQDPMLHYFISLALIIEKRDVLLQQHETGLPETLSKMCIMNAKHLSTLFLFACNLRLSTPPSASRLLHTITTSTIGASGEELSVLTNMLSLEVGADESLSQSLSNNTYSYADLISGFSNLYNTASGQLITVANSGSSAVGGTNQQIYQTVSSIINTTNSPNAAPTNIPFLFIDCRDEWSFRRGHLSSAINFPLHHLTDPGLRQQLLQTIAGFKLMHVCLIHDGFQPGTNEYGSMTPSRWGNIMQQVEYYNNRDNEDYIAEHQHLHMVTTDPMQQHATQIRTLTGLIAFLIFKGVRYVSVVANGYLQIHKTAIMLGVELVNHDEGKCPLCLKPELYYGTTKNLLTTSNSSNNNNNNNNNNNTNGNNNITGGRGNVSSEEGGYASRYNAAAGYYKQSTQGLFSSLSKFFSYPNNAATGGGNVNGTVGTPSLSSYIPSPSTPSTTNNNNNNNVVQSPSSLNQTTFTAYDVINANNMNQRDDSTEDNEENQYKQQQQQELILVPPSLINSITISNLRNVTIHGMTLRQTAQLAIQQLINIAVETFPPQFLKASKYPITGLEHNFVPKYQNNNINQDDNNNADEDDNNNTQQQGDSLWITGRIKTTSLPNNMPLSTGYLLQSQLAIIGITKQITYMASEVDETVKILSLKDNTIISDDITFAHNVMLQLLQNVTKQFDNMFLINTGSVEVLPNDDVSAVPRRTRNINKDPNNSDDNITSFLSDESNNATPIQKKVIKQNNNQDGNNESTLLYNQYTIKPIKIPYNIQSQYTLFFVPTLTTQTTPSILSTIEYFLKIKNTPQKALALITFTTSKEAYELLQVGFANIIEDLMLNGKENNHLLYDPTCALPVVALSLTQQQPINKQSPYISNDDTRKFMYQQDDEHLDIFPSIPQFYARYLRAE